MAEHTSCAVEGCNRPTKAHGWCKSHYARWRRHGDPGPADIRPPGGTKAACSVEGCERPAKTRGWCQSHYIRWWESGDVGGAEIGPRSATMGVCSVAGCGRRAKTLGWCQTHYNRSRANGDPGTDPIRSLSTTDGTCFVDGCEKDIYARSWCVRHYENWRLRGDALTDGPGQGRRPKKYLNEVCLVEGCERPPGRSHGWCDLHYNRWQRTGAVGPAALLAVPKGQGDYIDTGGYRIVCHPMTRKPIAEHRLVMERILGRPLQGNENVHHRNGERLDNRPENLELWVKGQPCGQRVTDVVAWAKEIVATYEAIAKKERRRLGD